MRQPQAHRIRLRLACLAAVLSSGCSSSLGGLIGGERALWWSRPTTIADDSEEFHSTVQVRYLGTGGFLIRRGPDVVMTAPFFSNPNVVRVALPVLPLRPNRRAIEAALAPFEPDLADVKAILVGHAHYDHLMDLPYIYGRTWQGSAAPPPVFANRTACHLLAADSTVGPRVTDLDDRAVTHKTEDPQAYWFRVPGTGADPHPEAGGVRILALASVHGPQIPGGIALWKGEVTRPQSKLPRTAKGWKGGRTLAFLIDFLRKDGSVAFRVHYADAASEGPNAFIPPALPQHATDLAILCLGAYGEVKDYPGSLLANVAPRHIVIGHWESFFRAAHKTPRSNPTSHPRGFLERLQSAPGLHPGAQYWLPAPRTLLRFPTSPRP